MSWLHIVTWAAAVVVVAIFGKLFLLPWAPPLYRRYLEFVQKKASGK